MADKDVKSTTEKPTAIVRPFSVNGVEIDYAKKKWIYPKHPRRTSRFFAISWLASVPVTILDDWRKRTMALGFTDPTKKKALFRAMQIKKRSSIFIISYTQNHKRNWDNFLLFLFYTKNNSVDVDSRRLVPFNKKKKNKYQLSSRGHLHFPEQTGVF